jgi:hypothetical protein
VFFESHMIRVKVALYCHCMVGCREAIIRYQNGHAKTVSVSIGASLLYTLRNAG